MFSRSTIDDSGSIIDDSASIIDDPRSIIDNSRSINVARMINMSDAKIWCIT
jgi:hypothetical protein